MYNYCVIDMPDHPSLETLVGVCRAQVRAYAKHGGKFDADTQVSNLAGTKVKLFTEGEFPVIVQNAPGFVELTESEANTMLASPEYATPISQP